MTTHREPLVLEDRHTGERLELRRIREGGVVRLELRGSLPPHTEGPPLHMHFEEHERGMVHRGVLTALVDGVRIQAGAGEQVDLPKGSAHRWWNEGDEPLEFSGTVDPVVDLDRFLQAVFDVANAGPAGRPPMAYLAHVMLRHRKTQAPVIMPRPIQALVFRIAYLFGLLTGRFRGDDWPGCASRCPGAPEFVVEDA